MTTKPNEPEGLCALCGHARHRHGSGYPATCPIIPTYRAPAQPVADAGGVTVDLVREWLMSTDHPVSQWEREFAAAIDAHRLQSVAAATAGMPTIWEDPAGKGYPCFERPMTPAEVREGLSQCFATIDGLHALVAELGDKIAAKDAEIARLKGQFSRYFHEAANAQEEVARLREGIERALCCTPHIRSERSQFHGIGDTHKIVYDCGNPWEILRAALSEAREAGDSLAAGDRV